MLLIAQRRGLLDANCRWLLVGFLCEPPVKLDEETADRVWTDISHLAEGFHLSSYDAAYLELAQRRELPLASLGQDLQEAAATKAESFGAISIQKSRVDINLREQAMFIAMNRFKVVPKARTEFERVWTTRDSHLGDVPGFIEFHLLRGPERDDHVLYSSHTLWRSRADFENWTRSEAFRRAHQDAGANRPLYIGHPEFEGFEVVQTVKAPTPL